MSVKAWHQDDILDFSATLHFVATASVDGEICICNILSGQLLHHLKPFTDLIYEQVGPSSIDKLLYLDSRNGIDDAANLVSVGSDGKIRFWSTVSGHLMAEFDNSDRFEAVAAMCVNTDQSFLITGDSSGYIKVYDISETCWSYAELEMPLVCEFRAHAKTIVSLDIIKGQDIIITASEDCTVRLFSV